MPSPPTTREAWSMSVAGLTLAEKTELLQLLELREQIEREKPPDTRPTLESFCDEARDQAAASRDPEAYITAWNG